MTALLVAVAATGFLSMPGALAQTPLQDVAALTNVQNDTRASGSMYFLGVFPDFPLFKIRLYKSDQLVQAFQLPWNTPVSGFRMVDENLFVYSVAAVGGEQQWKVWKNGQLVRQFNIAKPTIFGSVVDNVNNDVYTHYGYFQSPWFNIETYKNGVLFDTFKVYAFGNPTILLPGKDGHVNVLVYRIASPWIYYDIYEDDTLVKSFRFSIFQPIAPQLSSSGELYFLGLRLAIPYVWWDLYDNGALVQSFRLPYTTPFLAWDMVDWNFYIVSGALNIPFADLTLYENGTVNDLIHIPLTVLPNTFYIGVYP